MLKQTNQSTQPEPNPKQSLASSNWLALQKRVRTSSRSTRSRSPAGTPRKRQKLSHVPTTNSNVGGDGGPSSLSDAAATVEPPEDVEKADTSLNVLREMIIGKLSQKPEHSQPGKYIAIDCEMVGVGINGSESSLGRVSVVNYHGVVQLDEFVKQREKVADYRTQYSGIRATDMVKARPFEEVQKRVAELMKGKIVIGHAIHNDLQALLLSHPRSQIRDTQVLAGKFKLVRSKYIALRNLVKQEFNVTIQNGEHSSVTDSRASMAIYRLHRREWEKGLATVTGRRGKSKKG